MIVKTIELDGFRNYGLQRAQFDPRVNVIAGDNAQGKTNLLEAICCLSSGKPFRARTDREAVGFGREYAALRAEFFAEDRDQTMSITFFPGKRRQITVNGARLRSAAELAGKVRAVLFCPDDLDMIRQGAAVRRKLMDTCLCQMRPRYAQLLAAFNRTLEQKSRILKSWREMPSLLGPLDEYNERLAALGAELVRYRARFAKAMGERAAAIHGEFSGGNETLEIRYNTVSAVTDPSASAKTLACQLQQHQSDHRRAELECGQCLSGVHKDDLEIAIDGRAAKTYASQGQARTAALSVKLAERELLFDDSGEYPLLLLDDVLSELDAVRRSFVLNHIDGGQVFITCCDEADVRSAGGKTLRIRAGVIG